jgi:multisubunit Na+/H+ antiporter MnhB subunit
MATATTTPARRPWERAKTAGVTTALTFVVFLVAMQHETSACGQACYDTGLRTYVGGQHWTAYEGAWQWQAQWLIAFGALIAAIASLVTTERLSLRRWTTRLLALSVLLGGAWVAWRLLEPPIPS